MRKLDGVRATTHIQHLELSRWSATPGFETTPRGSNLDQPFRDRRSPRTTVFALDAVSDRVNHVRADDPELLTPVAEPPAPTWTQPSLFDDAA